MAGLLDNIMGARYGDRAAPKTGAEVFEKLGYVPTARQREFHDATEFAVLYGGAAGGGKMLRVDEPIPTPGGWSTIGALSPGDYVFDDHGQPTIVEAVHPVDDAPNSYRLTFDDGSTIDACAEHLWLTYTAAELAALTKRTPDARAARRAARPTRGTGKRPDLAERNRRNAAAVLAPPAGAVRTTAEIAATLTTRSGRSNHAMPVAGALALPDADLPIDPYLLGAWLGDGSTSTATFTSADEHILDEFRRAGVTVRPTGRNNGYDYTLGDTIRAARVNGRPGAVNTWTRALRVAGVLGDKHIPAVYLRASAAQRLALLQGLMDTDGTATEAGSAEFTTSSARLAEDVHELIVSLGWKARIREGRAKLNGVDCGPKFTIKWMPSQIVFRLPRKAARQGIAQRRTTRFRYVVACEPVTPVPMRCITVGNASGLYLAGRNMLVTHNTKALLMEGVRKAIEHPGLRVGAFRRTLAEIRESLLVELFAVLHPLEEEYRARLVQSPDIDLRFPNGSIIMFRYAENIQDATRRQGGQYQLLLFDERTLMPPDVPTFLESRLRSGDRAIPVIGVRSGSNPGGAGHGSVRKQYIDATDYGQKIVRDEGGRSVRFIPSKLDDNPHLNPEYEKQLEVLPEAMRKAFREGNWDVFAGQVFTEWNRDRHVIPAFPLDPSWARYAGVDWGFAAPWAVEWGAVDEDSRVYIYRELYGALVGETEQATRILAAEDAGEHVIRYADDAMWTKRGDAKSVAQIYADNACPLTPAQKGERVNGWQRMHTYLAEGPACPHHRALGWVTCPMLHVFEGAAPELVRTLPALPYSTRAGNPEDVDTTAEDHAPDALRYLLINLGGGARMVFDETTKPEQPVEHHGTFAIRPDPTVQGLTFDPTRDPLAGAAQKSPFV